MIIDEVKLPLRIAVEEINRICMELERCRENYLINSEHMNASTGRAATDLELLQTAKQLLSERRKRDSVFTKASFSDPQWDIMLDLFIAKISRRKISISSACIGANVPPTTALRHLSCMVENGLLEREECNHDIRVRYIAISTYAETIMREYLSQVLAVRF